MENITTDRHLERTGQCFEDALDLMMLIGALGLDVEIHLRSIAQALEEMKEHLRGHLSDLLTLELRIPYQPGPSAEVESYLAQAVIHGQTIAIALDAALVTEGAQQTLAQGERRIFYRMMLIHVEVALRMDCQVHHAMLADLVQHVVEEAQPGVHVGLSRSVKIDLHVYIRLFRHAVHLSDALAGKKHLGYLVPGHAILVQYQRPAAQIGSQLGVSLPVADDITVLKIILRIADIFLQHPCPRLAHGRIVLGEMAVDELVVEMDALSLQCLEYKVVNRPEGVLGEGGGAQPILIAHHHELEIEMGGYESEIAEHAVPKLQLRKGVDLLVLRLFYERAVTIDKEYSLLLHTFYDLINN